MKIESRGLLIIVSIVILVCIIFISFLLRKSPTSNTTVFPSPIPTSNAVTDVPRVNTTSLLSFKKINSTSIAVTIDSGAKAVSAIQLEISYDPVVLKNVTITQGTFFDDPFVLSSKADPTSKSIFYAVGIRSTQQPKIGQGTIAIISFTPVLGVATQTSLQFLPKTKVTAVGIDTSVLKESTGITIPIQ